MCILPNQLLVAAVLVATLGLLGATLLVTAGTGDSGEPNGNPAALVAIPPGLSSLPIPASNPLTARRSSSAGSSTSIRASVGTPPSVARHATIPPSAISYRSSMDTAPS